jgi:hypothetical protein
MTQIAADGDDEIHTRAKVARNPERQGQNGYKIQGAKILKSKGKQNRQLFAF